jgi:DNA-directed RNA polymerase subunit RPC12/RpoP
MPMTFSWACESCKKAFQLMSPGINTPIMCPYCGAHEMLSEADEAAVVLQSAAVLIRRFLPEARDADVTVDHNRRDS